MDLEDYVLLSTRSAIHELEEISARLLSLILNVSHLPIAIAPLNIN